jgi:hypothetical protein
MVGGDENYNLSGGIYYTDGLLTFPLSWLVFSSVLVGAYGFVMFTGIFKAPTWLCKWLERGKTPPLSL